MNLKYEDEWRPLFPYAEPRLEQADAIDRAIGAIRSGKRFVIMDLPTGVGKAQPMHSKVLTPSGWAEMGCLKKGDLVMGANGHPVRVSYVIPQGVRSIYRISFNDGSSTLCCDEHLWAVKDANDRSEHRDWRVVDLSEIRGALRARKDRRRNFSIPVANPIHFDGRELPIDPYILGALIGDGTLRDYTKSSIQSALLSLGLAGCRSSDKFIPDLYKFSGLEQRVSLLRGLMDTDGTVNKSGTTVQFCTVSQRLAMDMVDLIRSLGGIGRISEQIKSYRDASNSFRNGQLAFIVNVNLPPEINPFTCERKRSRVVSKSKYVPARFVESVEYVGDEECQCIKVDAEDSLYITDDYIVTHNSAAGITLARWAEKYLPEADQDSMRSGATFITTQKVLQDQYMGDFTSVGLRNLKSSSNYDCDYSPEDTCKEGRILMTLKGDSDAKRDYYKKWRESCGGDGCKYVAAREAFRAAALGVTSFAYFLHGRANVPARTLLVIDEAHNIESQLMSFVEFRVTRSFAEGMLGLKWPSEFEDIHEDSPKAAGAREKFKNWLNEKYLPAIEKEEVKARKRLGDLQMIATPDSNVRDQIRNAERVIEAKRHISAFLKSYNKHEDNWVAQIESKPRKNGDPVKTLVYKTVDVAPHAQSLLYNKARFVVCMSATILNSKAFAASVGIPEGEYEAISHGSPFPPENRMVYMDGCGSMTYKEKDATLPIMADEIEKLLEEFSGKKGIIHAHTYANANFLRENIRGKHKGRLLFHDSSDRDVILEHHKDSKSDTVLVSPSMAEGVDLKDDLSRFQIIMKVPYPFLGDPLVKRKMELNDTWYSYQTVKIICQMIGRSVRSADDSAATFILDSNFNTFYRRAKRLFPAWFKDAYFIA